jgi:hypothetical protein
VPRWVVPDDEGRPVATALNEEKLRHMLARLARWVRVNAKGEPRMDADAAALAIRRLSKTGAHAFLPICPSNLAKNNLLSGLVR